MQNDLIAIANAIRTEKYPNAETIFLAGSVVRGEATSTSDLDLVVVFKTLASAYRESFRFMDWPVEAFVHDPETLRYFFFKVDYPSGVPSLPAMVSEGIAIPQPSEFSRTLKRLADSTLAQGPPPWHQADIDRSRYTITELIDDLRTPRTTSELTASGAILYGVVANHYLRKRNLWSAKGKTIPRRLHKVAPKFAHQFNESFEALFKTGQTAKLIALVEAVLEPDGGWLFEGYQLSAPPAWRQAEPLSANL